MVLFYFFTEAQKDQDIELPRGIVLSLKTTGMVE